VKNAMVIGMDYYRDSAKKNMSVVAFIASLNGTQENRLNCTRYFSRCHLQPTDDEFCSGLTVFMTEALNKYFERNNTYPDRIFIYRDGVSDGQFKKVQEFEIPQLKTAFASINENYDPRLTFFVVKKRGNARFFLKDNRNDFQNPPIGTVIDTGVTKDPLEFYLISQSTNQGTVSPTHFHILEDKSGLTPDKLQIITYRFTHLYYNWPAQIRVPAPCHYASKLAHLVGESLHRPHAPALDDKLFYL
ncbi:PIWI protein, partial [Brachionus plicatilis]